MPGERGRANPALASIEVATVTVTAPAAPSSSSSRVFWAGLNLNFQASS